MESILLQAWKYAQDNHAITTSLYQKQSLKKPVNILKSKAPLSIQIYGIFVF